VHDAIRSFDKNHLLLGPRYHGKCINHETIWQATSPYVDILSFNYFSNWCINKNTTLAKLAIQFKKPFVISEFYTKSVDSELPNQAGAGWLVHTQTDRGYFYSNFVLQLIDSKYGLGCAWLRYMDNPTGEKALQNDPSNRGVNKGLINTHWVPYTDALAQMEICNKNMYQYLTKFL
jgi:hypothetical protein